MTGYSIRYAVLHSFSFRQWLTTSGSAFGQFPAMTDYIRFSFVQFPATTNYILSEFVKIPVITYYIRFCIFSVSGNDGLYPVLLVPADSRGPPTEAGGGQTRVRHLSQEVSVQPSSPGIPAEQSSSLGTLRTCSQLQIPSKFSPRVQRMTFLRRVQLLSRIDPSLKSKYFPSSSLFSRYCHRLSLELKYRHCLGTANREVSVYNMNVHLGVVTGWSQGSEWRLCYPLLMEKLLKLSSADHPGFIVVICRTCRSRSTCWNPWSEWQSTRCSWRSCWSCHQQRLLLLFAGHAALVLTAEAGEASDREPAAHGEAAEAVIS